MKKGELIGKIFGIALVFVMIGTMLATMLPLGILGENQVSAQEGISYIIVHALNPEGIEIASIEGMDPHCVEIYDGETLIGYGAHDNETYNKPIAISPGAHTIRVKFNGMISEENINIQSGETKILVFTFERVEFDLVNHLSLRSGGGKLEYRGIRTDVLGESGNRLYEIRYLDNGNPTGGWYRVNVQGGYWNSDYVDIAYHVRSELLITESVFEADVYAKATVIRGNGEVNAYADISLLGNPYGHNEIIQSTDDFSSWFVQGIRTGDYPPIAFSFGYENSSYPSRVAYTIYPSSCASFPANRCNYPITRINWSYQCMAHVYGSSGEDHEYYSGTLTSIKMSSVPYDIMGTGIKYEETQPPVANFTYCPENPLVGQDITFDASSSYDPNGEIVSYDWDFDASDGIQMDAEGEVVTHAYSEAGEYTVRLMVTDNDELTDSIAEVITVTLGSQPPVASFVYYPKNLPSSKSMVGGITIFDASASYDPDGQVVKYEWDFGDGETGSTSDSMYDHIFKSPRKHVVTLMVTDDDGLTNSKSLEIDFTLANGDLLLCRSEGSWVPANFWSHVGIYDKPSNSVIEARFVGGVGYYPLSDWFFPNQTCVRALQIDTDQAIRDAAVAFASAQVGCQYDLFSILIPPLLGMKNADNSDGLGWYCSELVWGAYLWASNGLINLDMDAFAVGPDEIASSGWVQTVGEHREAVPDTVYQGGGILWGQALCSIDLVITDPDGLVLAKNLCGIPGAVYRELDVDRDGDLDDAFMIPERKMGAYSIRVIPEPGALPTDTYSLEVTANGQTIVLAEDVQISDIPSEPYVIGAEANSPPNIPSNPSPANHATGVDINANLSWTGGDPDAEDTVTYDVYFGTSETPTLKATIGPYLATQSSITYDPGTLADGMTYYWQIVARDNHGITREGPVWEFTTGGLPQDEPSPALGFAGLVAEGKLVIAYNFDPFTTVPTAVAGWTWFDPTLPPAQNNLAKLHKNTAYWVKVTEECWLTYGTQNYHLAAGWNNPVWLGC